MDQLATSDQPTPHPGKRINDLPFEVQTMILKYHFDEFPAKTITVDAHTPSQGPSNATTAAVRAVHDSQALNVLLACSNFYAVGKPLIEKYALYKLNINFSRLDETFYVWDASIDYDQVRRLQLNVDFGKNVNWKDPAFRGQLDKLTAKLFDFKKATQVNVAYKFGVDHASYAMDLRYELTYNWGKTLRTLPSITGSDQLFVFQDAALGYVVEHEKRARGWWIFKRMIAGAGPRQVQARRYGFPIRTRPLNW